MLSRITCPRLFQAWQPPLSAKPACSREHPPDYIQLPAVRDYPALTNEELFPAIQAQFLSDIQKLRRLAHNFVHKQYDDGINAFHNMLKAPPNNLHGHLLPLYRETRYQIHQLVATLENHKHMSSAQSDYIASRLHDCLNDIENCPAGVHSRFANSFINLEAAQGGLDGILFHARQELLHQSIASFLFQQQRQFLVDIPA